MGTTRIQNQLRQMRHKQVNKLVDQQKEVEDEGEPVRLTSKVRKSKRWYDAMYQDSIAVAVNEGANARLFITVSGRDNVEEVRQVQDKRKKGEMPETT